MGTGVGELSELLRSLCYPTPALPFTRAGSKKAPPYRTHLRSFDGGIERQIIGGGGRVCREIVVLDGNF
jgi:hypothetical protein